MKANPFKQRREQLGMTQRQVAEFFTPRLAVATVGCWERGVAAPRRVLTDDLVRVYQKPREWVESASAAVRKLREAGKGELVKA